MRSLIANTVVGLAFLFLGCLPAWGDERLDIAKCAAERNSVKRLECFDTLAHRIGVAQPKAGSYVVSKWRVRTSTSRIDDNTNVVVGVDADSSIAGWPPKTYTPSLVLRCTEGRTNVYIITGMPPQVEHGTDGATVTLRFDKDPAFKASASKSTDGEALFFDRSVALIKQMMKYETLLFQFVPFNSSPVMTTFDIRGVTEAVQRLRKECKW